MTQMEFAKIIGANYTTVCRWERRSNTPTFKTQAMIDKLCKENGIIVDGIRRKEQYNIRI